MKVKSEKTEKKSESIKVKQDDKLKSEAPLS